jgi:photosystem II stability/assembly factor-like uncharacterized protein
MRETSLCSRRRPGVWVCALAVALAVASGAGGARPARANGAFPDGFTVVLRPDRPREILVATNFGVVSSDDDGATWRFTCEEDRESRNTYRFGAEVASPYRIFALGQRAGGAFGLVMTADDGCTWVPTMGTMGYLEARDYFLELAGPKRIFALAAYHPTPGVVQNALFVSSDGGASFGAPLRAATNGVSFASVESARSAPDVLYLVVQEGAAQRIERSDDGGKTWQGYPLDKAWGEQFFIIAVDPEDSQRLLVRAIAYVGGLAVDKLLSSRDGGKSWKVGIDLSPDGGGALGSFLRRADGTLHVAGQMHKAGFPPVAYSSADRGETWVPWDTRGVRVRGMAERAGTMYVVANELLDGFALGRGPAEGAPWQPLLRFAQITGIKPCARSRCQAACLNLSTAFALFPRSVCDEGGMGGQGGSSNRRDGGVEGGTGRGCGCRVAGGGDHRSWWLASGALLAVVVARASRRRRRRSAPRLW